MFVYVLFLLAFIKLCYCMLQQQCPCIHTVYVILCISDVWGIVRIDIRIICVVYTMCARFFYNEDIFCIIYELSSEIFYICCSMQSMTVIIFVYRLLLIIVHTKARVRRYQQLNPSNMSYLVHLPSLVRAFSCHPSHTSSMSSYSHPSLHHLPPLNVCT